MLAPHPSKGLGLQVCASVPGTFNSEEIKTVLSTRSVAAPPDYTCSEEAEQRHL